VSEYEDYEQSDTNDEAVSGAGACLDVAFIQMPQYRAVASCSLRLPRQRVVHPVLFEYIIWKSVKFEFFYKVSVCLDERGPSPGICRRYERFDRICQTADAVYNYP